MNDTVNFTSQIYTIENVLLAIFLIFLIITTVFGNMLVVMAILINIHLRSPTHLFMGSLAIADLLVG